MLRSHVPQGEAVYTVSSLLLHIPEDEKQILSSKGSSQDSQGKNWMGKKKQGGGGECLEPRAHHSIDDSLQNSRDPSLSCTQFFWFRPQALSTLGQITGLCRDCEMLYNAHRYSAVLS